MNVGRLAVVVTLAAWCAYFGTWLYGEFISPQHTSGRLKVEAVVYLVVVTLLTASALAYLVCRLGYFYRARGYQRVPKAALDQYFAGHSPSMTVIVPSYKEETRVIRTTLLSAALQEYEGLRVVLLIDDPPAPRRRHDRELLAAARALPGQLQALLAEPLGWFRAARQEFETATVKPTVLDMVTAAKQFDRAVGWLHTLAESTEIVDHSDRFFSEHVVLGLAADFSLTASALRSAAAEEVALPRERIAELYARLERTFAAELSSFERKRYESLSHEANKAMNLNSYIGLMGGAYQDTETLTGRVLVPSAVHTADLVVPDPDYVLTLDADSILLPEYCLRLVHLMEKAEYRRVGVAQTPYSAYPGAATRLERIAGASTDIQHVVHQGMTHYQATFWVGANAVLRKEALDQIRETTYQGNWEIHRYIQDRTVIEDTESTVDLRAEGWQLVNFPERLSYSATPADFGSLCIQRRRWANGGLLILSKLRRQRRQAKARGETVGLGERFLRLNYMASICWSSLSLLLLLAYPFHNDLVSPFLGLVALPYFIAQASDLRLCGYRRLDVIRIYGFNLVLLPVNLAGVTNSLVQALTGDKSVFGRTPKVRDRTIPNFLFIVTPYLIVALATYTAISDYHGHRWDNLVYAALNTVLAAYAIVAYIGLRHSVADVWLHFKNSLYQRSRPPVTAQPSPSALLRQPPTVDWASVLHFGGPDAVGPSRRLTPTWGRGAGRDPGDTGEAARRRAPAAADDHGEFRTVFQPVFDLTRGRVVGYEALSRFDDGVAPDRRLAEATGTGAGVELEMLLARAGVAAARGLPAEPWLALNMSSALMDAGTALRHLAQSAGRPLVVEIPAVVLDDPERMAATLAELDGVSLSITGVESNYDALNLVQRANPRFVKLDPGWLDELADDPARQALIAALVALTSQAVDGPELIAEGIETDAQLAELRRLGVGLGQGFLLGRPSQRPATGVDLAPMPQGRRMAALHGGAPH